MMMMMVMVMVMVSLFHSLLPTHPRTPDKCFFLGAAFAFAPFCLSFAAFIFRGLRFGGMSLGHVGRVWPDFPQFPQLLMRWVVVVTVVTVLVTVLLTFAAGFFLAFLGFLTTKVAGAVLRAALVASFLRGFGFLGFDFTIVRVVALGGERRFYS